MDKELLNKLADFAKESTVNYTVGTCSNYALFEINVEQISEFLKDIAAAPVRPIIHVLRWAATDAAKSLDEKTRIALFDILEVLITIYGNQQIIGMLTYWFEDLQSELSKALETK